MYHRKAVDLALKLYTSGRTDFLGAKAVGLAVAGLIRQTEGDKGKYAEDATPDFVTNDLRGAFDWIVSNKDSNLFSE